jgi:ACS family glucarate transporter-like MFS transporter
MPHRYLLVCGTFLLSVLLYVDRACISAAKNDIAVDLKLSNEQMAWVLGIFTLGYALFQTPGGWLADRFGPRRLLTGIVMLWSLFTGLTAAAFSFPTILAARFLFGAGEAGAFPGLARACFSWFPMQERGIVQGINFSGSRLGAALALPGVAVMIDHLGWRMSFVTLMVVGAAFAIAWWIWFRDEPAEQSNISQTELQYILEHRQQIESSADGTSRLTPAVMASSPNMWLVCLQYFSSNFTFFFCLTHWFPHLKSHYDLANVEAGLWASAPLVAGAFGNWFSGSLIDALYRRGHWTLSRRLPAVIGFVLATIGVLISMQQETVGPAVAWFCVAVFGADMTLAPSWSFCMDIGKRHSGVVSGTMNMAGNIGSLLTTLAYFYLKEWSGAESTFFYVAAALNAVAIGCWLVLNPQHPLKEVA